MLSKTRSALHDTTKKLQRQSDCTNRKFCMALNSIKKKVYHSPHTDSHSFFLAIGPFTVFLQRFK